MAPAVGLHITVLYLQRSRILLREPARRKHRPDLRLERPETGGQTGILLCSVPVPDVSGNVSDHSGLQAYGFLALFLMPALAVDIAAASARAAEFCGFVQESYKKLAISAKYNYILFNNQLLSRVKQTNVNIHKAL